MLILDVEPENSVQRVIEVLVQSWTILIVMEPVPTIGYVDRLFDILGATPALGTLQGILLGGVRVGKVATEVFVLSGLGCPSILGLWRFGRFGFLVRRGQTTALADFFNAFMLSTAVATNDHVENDIDSDHLNPWVSNYDTLTCRV